MTLRLFAIRHITTRKLQPEFFPSKAAAKKARDELNGNITPIQYVVTYGPDHRRTP